jgi:hypothetical protein
LEPGLESVTVLDGQARRCCSLGQEALLRISLIPATSGPIGDGLVWPVRAKANAKQCVKEIIKLIDLIKNQIMII